jgi:cytochrome oxidase assembly protein ShyY1
VLRTALKPRWLALLVLALLAATAMAWLGNWQFQRARENSRRETIEAKASRPAVPLTDLLKPRQSFTNGAADRPITAAGTWDGAHQLLVADRLLSGRPGLWVLTPLRLPDGSAVAVVRGWTASAADPAVAPSTLPVGTVQLAGVLRPSEPPLDRPPGAGTGLPAGQLPGVDLTQLVQLWPYKLITGYVVATAQQPGATGAGAGLAAVPPTAPGTQELAWQNLSYAVQWFVFAGFGIFIWWRLVRDDHQGRLPAAGGGSPTPGVAVGTAGDTDATGSGAGTSTATEPLSERGAHP